MDTDSEKYKRKKRADGSFRKTKHIKKLIENNPNISPEEIAEFRKLYWHKIDNIKFFVKNIQK